MSNPINQIVYFVELSKNLSHKQHEKLTKKFN